MIKHLKLTNVKKHRDLDITFTQGVNVICGANYQGKSSVLHGILIALFGVSAAPGRSDRIWTRDTSKSSVSLTLEIQGQTVLITRTRSSAVLYEGGEETCRGTSPVNSRVLQLLGLSKSDFMNIKYAAQKETEGLLSFGAQGLRSLIERVSGAELLSLILADAGKEAASHQGAIDALKPSDIEQLRGELKQVDERLQMTLDTVDALRTEQDKAQGNLVACSEELLKRVNQREKVIEQQKAKENDLASLKETESGLDLVEGYLKTQQVVTKEAVETLQARASEAEESLSLAQSLKEQAGQAQKELDRHQDAERACREQIAKFRTEEASVTSEIASLEGSESKEQDLLRRHSSITQMLKANREALASSCCPTCHRPYDVGFDREALSEEVGRLAAQEGELQTLLGQASELAARFRTLSTRATLLRTMIDSKEADTLPSILAQAEHHRAILLNAEDSLSGIHVPDVVTVKALKQEAEEAYEVLLSVTRAEERKSSLLSQRKILQDRLAGYPETFSYPSVQDAEEARLLAGKALQDLQESLRVESDRGAGYRAEAESLRKQIAEGEKSNEALREHETHLATAKSLQKFLKDNREKFLAESWAGFLAMTSSFVSDATGGAISEVSRDGEAFQYVEEGYEMDLTAASGAQRAIIGLGVKVSLALTIRDHLQCLLLDEVTADMDEEHAGTVTALLGSLGHQVIAVSHREMDRSGDYNIIHL